ncbi:hypothetical protein [Adlercreutzia sp. ZJ154]|uniref:hypothetical protein n=1 Tax=Adlercreutzia sp. ZJ154 TaxID=2709790 RepID=UPI00197D269A|nr:hypothetical protein [Adlercreutzia sp. ZJ154]
MNKVARGFALFMNWFDGVCAFLCGLWMMASALFTLPLSWNDWMPISLLDPLPLPDFMKSDFLWPGLALMLVNGVPNIIALVLRFRGNREASYAWGCIAGALLIVWTVFEMVFIPNGLSVFYLVLGVMQLVASARAFACCNHDHNSNHDRNSDRNRVCSS